VTTPRRGHALALTLFALVLLAVLAAAAFFAASQDERVGRNAVAAVRSRSAAESALHGAIDAWDAPRLDSMTPGAPQRLAASHPIPGSSVTLEVRRLNALLFLLLASDSGKGDVRQQAQSVVRLAAIETAPAAVRARTIDASLVPYVHGGDLAPAGWSCAAAPRVAPALDLLPGAADSVLFRFGPWGWNELAAWAAAVPPGGDSLGVRYEPADLVLTGGRFTGVLVVEGNLTLELGAEIVGLAAVRGVVHLRAPAGRIAGQVVASQVVADNAFTSPVPDFSWSSCSVLMVSRSRALPEPLSGLPVAPKY